MQDLDQSQNIVSGPSKLPLAISAILTNNRLCRIFMICRGGWLLRETVAFSPRK